MRKLMLLVSVVFLSVLFAPFVTRAAKLDIAGTYSIYMNKELDPGKGVTLSIGLWELPVYLRGSYEKTRSRLGGQEVCDTEVYGVLFGVKRKNSFIEIGYFKPDLTFRPSYKEGLWIEINRILHQSYNIGSYSDNGYGYEMNKDFGIAFGTRAEFQLTRGLYAYLSVAGRYLRFEDVITCHFPNERGFWETYASRDFSAVQAFVGLMW